MECCLFEEYLSICPGDNENLISISETRFNSVKDASESRKDSLKLTLSEDHEKIRYAHKNCLSTYTSKTHIKRYIKRCSEQNNTSSEVPCKRLRRSQVTQFEWKTCCFFCGKTCLITPDPKHPDRWRKAFECRTSERGKGNLTFKEVILKVRSFAIKETIVAKNLKYLILLFLALKFVLVNTQVNMSVDISVSPLIP